ncbi:MAG: EutN/CcmL family microcompartment protein [bacterium]|nr:EutN/CcmL family microcompartment protein [bacterium]
MVLGKVIGSVWATKKDPGLEGMKFLIVGYLDEKENFTGDYDVAVDSVGAGYGELVLIAKGSSARQTQQTHNRPVDAVIMAIVDKYDIHDKE